jgi:hypothetical protein
MWKQCLMVYSLASIPCLPGTCGIRPVGDGELLAGFQGRSTCHIRGSLIPDDVEYGFDKSENGYNLITLGADGGYP